MKLAIIPPLASDVAYMFNSQGGYRPVIVHGRGPTWDDTSFDGIVFCGGTDVDPRLYGEQRAPLTQHPDVKRDEWEMLLANRFKDLPKIGICRGGQLLHIFNGGKLRQHIPKHSSGEHTTIDSRDKPFKVQTSSVHHQEMLPGNEKGEYFAFAEDGIVEGVWYKETKSLCVQFHPEWGPPECTEYFFGLMEHYYG